MNIENSGDDIDASLFDTDKIKILTEAEIEQRAHDEALALAIVQDEIDLIGKEIENNISMHSLTDEGIAFLRELAGQSETFSRTLSYEQASELFYAIARLSDDVIPFNKPGDVMRQPHKDLKYKFNVGPQELQQASGLICFSKKPDIMASFESWALLKPTKTNPLAFSKLFVPVGELPEKA